MSLFDALIGLIIILGFMYVIYLGLQKKNPKIGAALVQFSPASLFQRSKIVKAKEIKQQTWTDNRSMI